MILNCKVCNKEYKRTGKQAQTASCCSHKCSSIYRKSLVQNNVKCSQCSKDFHMKPSQITRYKRTNGYFCSASCFGRWKSINTIKEKNPNYRGKIYDNEGNKLVWSDKFGRIKLHHAITFEILNIDKIPKGHHVHHRDCDHKNNESTNLVLLSISDHQWLHKQYGNATLWAFMNNRIELKTLVEWSNDKEKAKRLLPLNLFNQIGVFKLIKFGETPEVDNTEPS